MKPPEDGRGGTLATAHGLLGESHTRRSRARLTPEDQAEVDAWARRAAMANGFGDGGIEISSLKESPTPAVREQ